MSRLRCILSTRVFLIVACTGAALAQPAQVTVAKPGVTMPAQPDPVPVTVKGATTALLVFDMVDPICSTQPKCMETMIPALTLLIVIGLDSLVPELQAVFGALRP